MDNDATLYVQIPSAMLRQLKHRAVDEDVSLRVLVTRVLNAYLALAPEVECRVREEIDLMVGPTPGSALALAAALCGLDS